MSDLFNLNVEQYSNQTVFPSPELNNSRLTSSVCSSVLAEPSVVAANLATGGPEGSCTELARSHTHQ